MGSPPFALPNAHRTQLIAEQPGQFLSFVWAPRNGALLLFNGQVEVWRLARRWRDRKLFPVWSRCGNGTR